MLEMESDPNLIKQITDLIGQSAKQSTNRLQYYRLAFGAAGGFGSEIGFDQAKAAMEAFFGDLKIEVQFDPGHRTGSPAVVKLLMNLALSAGEAIIRGGILSINIEDKGGGSRFVVAAVAERVLVRDNVPDALAGRLAAEDLDPKSIPAALAAEIAALLGASIKIEEQSGSGFSIAAEVPGGTEA